MQKELHPFGFLLELQVMSRVLNTVQLRFALAVRHYIEPGTLPKLAQTIHLVLRHHDAAVGTAPLDLDIAFKIFRADTLVNRICFLLSGLIQSFLYFFPYFPMPGTRFSEPVVFFISVRYLSNTRGIAVPGGG